MAQSTRRLMMGAAGASGEKTYIDNVFSTYVYKGNNGNHTITNGIDNTEGGLLWTKARTAGESHTLFDTVRASNNAIYTNLSERDETRNFNLNFLSSGFSWNTSDGMVNNASHNYAAWNFRKKTGFFDIVTWTGNGSAPRSISHDLGSVPGLIMVKCTSSNSTDWMVWHRDFDAKDYITLNLTSAKGTNEAKFGGQVSGSAKPTSTTFALGASNDVNGNGNTYIAYLFAGGASTAATARSVDFNGNDYLSITGHSDLGFDTGDFTWEAWVKPTSYTSDAPIYIVENGGFFIYKNGSDLKVRAKDGTTFITTSQLPEIGQWTHVAVTRSGTTLRLFYNGVLIQSATCSYDFSGNQAYIGVGEGSYWNGYISNLRSISGTAVYTSSFKPPTEPLTNITNTKLLCCNNSSATGSTVTPSTISSSGDPTASTDSPFDDPEGLKFGEGGDQNIVKCGSFTGNGSATGPVVDVGFEPQWILTKNASISDEWYIFDSMRGIVTGGYDPRLRPNSSGTESSGDQRLDLTPTGFKITSDNGDINGNGNTTIYIAIRRPDGYVGKPVEVGTNAFNVVYGNSSSSIPNFPSNFPVDMGIYNEPTNTYSRYLHTRLVGPYNLKTDSTSAQAP